MKKVLSILCLLLVCALVLPVESPAPGTTTTIPQVTIAPASLTGCPVVPPEFQVVATECPAVVTECVKEATTCPAVVTECVQEATTCPAVITECVVKPTTCPAVVTECVQEPTYCPKSDCGGEGCTPGYWKVDQHLDSWEGTGYKEADPRNGRISNESPIGRALMGARVGDIVEASTPNGVIKFKILRIG